MWLTRRRHRREEPDPDAWNDERRRRQELLEILRGDVSRAWSAWWTYELHRRPGHADDRAAGEGEAR